MSTFPSNSFQPFFVPGMPRSGTTFLFHAFRKHPGVCLPNRKEVDFFNANLESGSEWFESLYPHREDGQICGDISPSYFLTNDFCEQARERYPEAKVVLGVRDPLEYAISFYQQRQTFDFKLPPFREFLTSYTADFGGNSIQVGFDGDQVIEMIRRMKDTFGSDLLLFDFSIIRKDPITLLKTVESFLELPPYFDTENVATEPVNASGRKNLKWLTYLLSRPLVVKTAETVLPRPLLQRAHSLFYRLSSGKKTDAPSPGIDEEDVAYARGQLSDQQSDIQNLFADSPFVLGDGTSYLPASAGEK